MPLERVSQGFRDISMTFQRHPLNDDIIALKNEQAIARSVRNIVFTTPGEKFFDEDFGSKISASLFENLDDISVFKKVHTFVRLITIIRILKWLTMQRVKIQLSTSLIT